MATVDTIRNITIQATTQGVDQATASLNKLSDAQDNVAQSGQSTATMTDQVASKQLSAQSAYDKLRTSIDSQYKSQQQLSKGETVLTSAFQQGIISAGTYAQMHDLLIDKYSKATPLSEAFAASVSGVKTQMVALASGMGPVGVLLAGFGPLGLVAAAGLGAAVAAIDYMVGEDDRMGELAQQIRNFGNTTGLTAQQIQQLEFAGAQFGATSENVANTLQRFSVSLAQLRQGTGPLFTDLNKINPQLVQQLSATTDVATAWNLLATAYANADKAQQNLLSRAVGGQRGSGGGGGAGATSQLLLASASSGIAGLQNPADLLTQDQIEKWAQLKTEIDETTQIAKNLMASIWTDEVLQRQLQAAKAMEDIAQGMKDIASQQSGLSWWQKMLDDMGRAELPAMGQQYPAIPKTPQQLIDAQVGPLPAYPQPLSSDLTPPTGPVTASPQVISAQAAALITALGPAATYSEKLDASLKKLAADYDNNVFGLKGTTDALNNYNRALSATSLTSAVTVTAAYVSALGPLASVTDQVNLKQLQLSKAMADGVPLTQAQETAILNLTRANAEWTQVNAQTAAGVFDMQAASKAAGDELQSWIDRKLLDPTNATQLANAHDILAAKLRQTQQAALDANPVLKALSDQEFALATATMTTANAAAAQVAHQLFPADWQAHLNDAAPAMAAFNSQLKDAMGLSENFANAFGQAMIQGKTMSQAMLSAVQSLESALISMISKQLVQQAFGGLLGVGGGNLFSGLFGGGASSTLAASNAAATGVSASDVAFAFSSGGMVGAGGKPVYVHPAYFDNAPHFAGGGVISDGGVPIIAHPGERILNRTETAAYNNSSSQPINIVNNNNFTGADPGTEARLRAYVDQSSKQAVTTAVQAVVRARSNSQISLQGR